MSPTKGLKDNRDVLFVVLKAWKPQMEAPAERMPSLFLIVFIFPPLVGGARNLSGAPLEALIPFIPGSILTTQSPPTCLILSL